MQAQVLATGLHFGEGPRWHHGKLWFSDFYDHAVETGKLLVVVEDHSEDADENLRVAEDIFSASGTVSIPLRS